MDLVDFRVQPPYRSFLGMHFFRHRPAVEDPVSGNPFAPGRRTPRSFEERSMSRFLAELDDAGVAHAVIVGQRAAARWGRVDNADLVALLEAHPGRFSGFAGIDPHEADAVEQVRRAVADHGCTGIHVVPGWCDPPIHDDHPLLLRVYEECARLGAVVMTTSSHFIGPDMDHARPVHVQRAAMAFPEVTFVVGHASWPWTTQAVALAMRCTNVYLMPDFYLYLPDLPGAADYVAGANTFLRHRTLYSSCYPSRSIEQALEEARALPVVPESVEPLFSANARRLLVPR
jgi:predicted TIM-barrel fold metal-dependent hydrolase